LIQAGPGKPELASLSILMRVLTSGLEEISNAEVRAYASCIVFTRDTATTTPSPFLR
jgi:hypothetical protein